MTMELYPWDLEENVEDAFVAYLKTKDSYNSMIIPARSQVEASYPLIVVEAGESDNTDDSKRIDGKRQMVVGVAIVTEALDYNGTAGSPELNQKARELHRGIKTQVVGWLAGNDTHKVLNAMNNQGVEFSKAYIGLQSRDAGDGKLTTTMVLDVIAQVKLIEEEL